MFIRLLNTNPRMFFTMLFLVVFSVCCHEFMHAFVALKMGDDTAARNGHLTLNPLKQMGVMSLVMLLFLGIAWGQVPVDPRNFRSRGGRVLTSLAGPLTNLGLWIVMVLLCFAVVKLGDNGFAAAMLAYGAMLNLVLFIFNLLPVPGLDGFSVVAEFFPRLFRRDSEIARGAYFLLIVLLFTCSDWIFGAAMAATRCMLRALAGAAA